VTNAPPSDSMQARAREVEREFAGLEDSIARYRYLVELGERMPRLSEAEKSDETRLPGCQFGLWILTDYDAERDVLRFRVDSDARISRGLAALLVRVLDGQPPAAIADASLDFMDTIGLRGHLSANRTNGLSAMIEEIRARAEHYARES